MAFLTLIERKILSLSQTRIGPTKVGVLGIFQPLSDAVKLFRNRLSLVGPITKIIYFFSPVLGLLIRIVFLARVPSILGRSSIKVMILFILIIFRLNVYPLLGAGWGSNRKYALLGRVRSVAQTISYEIRLSFIIISIFTL